MDQSENLEGGVYHYKKDEVGAATALVDQKRAEILEVMRTSECFTVSAVDAEREGILHSTFVVDLDSFGDDAIVFLTYAALKLVKDIAGVLDISMEKTFEMLETILEEKGEEDL